MFDRIKQNGEQVNEGLNKKENVIRLPTQII